MELVHRALDDAGCAQAAALVRTIYIYTNTRFDLLIYIYPLARTSCGNND